MSGLAALLANHNPPSVYQWHSAAPVPDVEHAVEHAGWCFRYLDGWTVEDRSTFLKAVASALDLADVESVDALSAALGEIDCGDHGLVLLWDGWSPLARADDAAFDDAIEAFRQRAHRAGAQKLAVILRGDGPELDLPELPIKH